MRIPKWRVTLYDRNRLTGILDRLPMGRICGSRLPKLHPDRLSESC